jgi:hypothetical protein
LEDKAKRSRAQYFREYRVQNKDKIAAINERYWVRRIEKMKAEQNENSLQEKQNYEQNDTNENDVDNRGSR